MAAPVPMGSETPWTAFTWGALLERALNGVGLCYGAYASADTTKPAAPPGALARMKDVTKIVLCAFQQRFDDLFPESEANATAVSDYSSVDVPADYGRLVKSGASVNGRPLAIIRSEKYAASLRSSDEGGGINLTSEEGTPAFGRFALKSPTATSTRRTLALFVYPPQTSAFTVHFIYKATARELSNDTDALRIPVDLMGSLLKRIWQEWAEHTNDLQAGRERKILFDAEADEKENVPVADGLTRGLTQGLPADLAPLDL